MEADSNIFYVLGKQDDLYFKKELQISESRVPTNISNSNLGQQNFDIIFSTQANWRVVLYRNE